MAQLYQTKIWQVRLPDGWKARKLYFDGATLFKPDGIGEISVLVSPQDSEYPKGNSATTEQFTGKLRGCTMIHNGKGTFNRFWWLSCKGRVLVVSYSCAPSFSEVERHEVDEILQSMEESDA
jgi:hypothetical protein